MNAKINLYRAFLILVILICLIYLFLQNQSVISGKITSVFATSNVSVSKYLSISFSSNLSDGISFGNVAVLPASNVNASHNYDGTSSETTLYIAVSEDGNTAVDFCTKADKGLTNLDLDVIGLANETYANFSTTNATAPFVADEVSLTTDYIKSGNSINMGSNNYYRFWLDVPAAQPSGDYNNTVSFKGVQTAVAC